MKMRQKWKHVIIGIVLHSLCHNPITLSSATSKTLSLEWFGHITGNRIQTVFIDSALLITYLLLTLISWKGVDESLEVG